MLDLNNDLATERSAEPFPLPNDEMSQKLTYRDEGDKILSDAVEKLEQPIVNGVLSSELRDLYEMQIYEQRKLQETINDVKKNVEFLYNGVSESDIHKQHHDANPLGGNFDFISSAKDRYKYLETEGERIEQTYRDYQHKIKSKYYPINDSDEDQIKIITTHKKKDYDLAELDKFLEATARASASSRVMRDEIENEMHEFSAQKEREQNAAHTLRSLENVYALIKSVSLPRVVTTNQKETIQDEKSNKKSSSIIKKSLLNDDDDTSLASTPRETFVKKKAREESSSETTVLDKQEEDTSTKKKFEISDYKGFFEKNNEKQEETKKDTTPPRKVQIVYSSTESSASSESSDEKSISIGRGKVEKRTDKNMSYNEDEEDFKW